MNIKRNAILHARHAWQSQWTRWIPWYAMNLTPKSSACTCTGIFSWIVKGFPSDRVRQDFVCPRDFDKSLLCLLRSPKVVPSCGTCHNAWIKSRENITYNYIYIHKGYVVSLGRFGMESSLNHLSSSFVNFYLCSNPLLLAFFFSSGTLSGCHCNAAFR